MVRPWLLGGATLLLAFGISQRVLAQRIYKCRDASGNVAYQDRVCTDAQQETRIEIATSPTASSPDDRIAKPTREPPRERVSRGSSRSAVTRSREPVSYECRAGNGEVFYAHAKCPKSITAKDEQEHARKQRGSKESRSEGVSAVALPRSEVCKRLAEGGTVGRAGHERDERVSTYERNVGRDPCRRW